MTHCYIRAKKELRALATMDGKEIFEYDLKSSYPYLLLPEIEDEIEKSPLY